MKIAIAGSTGFIGKQLTDYLLQNGNEIIIISRKDFFNKDNELAKLIISADVIINLAGSSVLCKWNKKNRDLILSSRVETTRLLVEAVKQNEPLNRPKLFINASATGIYSDSGIQDETTATLNTDFLAQVCKSWEKELLPLEEIQLRYCIVRTGIVLGTSGGSMAKMLPLFKAGLGGKISTGKQPFSFIHIADYYRAIKHLIENPKSSGIYNLVSPEPVTNEIFTKVLASCLHRPAIFTVPEFALKIVYGQASELLTKGVKVIPSHLLNEGFQFKYPDIASTLADLVQK